MDDNNKKNYPIEVDMKMKKKVGNWTYFIYNTEDTIGSKYADKPIYYPALYRYKNGTYIARKVNEQACYTYTVSKNCVYYLDSTLSVQSHGLFICCKSIWKKPKITRYRIIRFSNMMM